MSVCGLFESVWECLESAWMPPDTLRSSGAVPLKHLGECVCVRRRGSREPDNLRAPEKISDIHEISASVSKNHGERLRPSLRGRAPLEVFS